MRLSFSYYKKLQVSCFLSATGPEVVGWKIIDAKGCGLPLSLRRIYCPETYLESQGVAMVNQLFQRIDVYVPVLEMYLLREIRVIESEGCIAQRNKPVDVICFCEDEVDEFLPALCPVGCKQVPVAR